MTNFEQRLFPGSPLLNVRHSTFGVRYSTFCSEHVSLDDFEHARDRRYDVVGLAGVGGLSDLASLAPPFSASALATFSSMPYSVYGTRRSSV